MAVDRGLPQFLQRNIKIIRDSYIILNLYYKIVIASLEIFCRFLRKRIFKYLRERGQTDWSVFLVYLSVLSQQINGEWEDKCTHLNGKVVKGIGRGIF
jgi:hypothetical protein